MADVKMYWALVAEQRAKLLNSLGVSPGNLSRADIAHIATSSDRAVFIISVDRPLEGINGGSTCAATVEIAARRIVEATHRLATEEEIANFHADQRKRERLCAEIEHRKREADGKTVIMGRDVVEEIVGAAVARSSRSGRAGADK